MLRIYNIIAIDMQNEREKWICCKRGCFPDVPVPLNPDGTYRSSPVTELVISAQKLCGTECPPNCEYRQLAESLQSIKIRLWQK